MQEISFDDQRHTTEAVERHKTAAHPTTAPVILVDLMTAYLNHADQVRHLGGLALKSD